MKIMLNKALVLAVIVLFVGAGFVPSISGDMEPNKIGEIRDFVEYGYILDQHQDDFDQNGMVVAKSQKVAQSFKPTMTPLAKVDIAVSKNSHMIDGEDLVVSIREELDGPVLGSVALTDDQVSTSNEWHEFIFTNNIDVVPEKTYYIVLESDYSRDYPYSVGGDWGYYDDPYNRGSKWAWYYTGTEYVWVEYDWPDYHEDIAFRTYGYDGENQAEIVIDSIEGGFRVSADITNNGTATATDVDWSIDLEGGLILAGEHTEGVIDELAPGGTTTIRQTTLYGIGTTTITVTVGDATEQATGFILGPLVLGVEEI